MKTHVGSSSTPSFWTFFWSVLAILLMFLAFVGTIGLGSTQTNPPLGLDSASVGVSCNGGSSCTTQTLSLFAHQNDVVIVFSSVSPQSIAAKACSTVPFPECTANATVGLPTSSTMSAFQMRFEQQWSNADISQVYVFWSIAQSTGTQSITVPINSNLAGWSSMAVSIIGANTTHPFDPNPGNPMGIIGNTGSQSIDFNDCNLSSGCSVAFNTDHAPDLTLLGIASEGNPTFTAPSGFTMATQIKLNGYLSSALSFQNEVGPQINNFPPNWLMPTGASCEPQATTNFCGQSAFWFDLSIQGLASQTTSSSSSTTPCCTTSSTSSTTTNSTSTITGCGCTSTSSSSSSSHSSSTSSSSSTTSSSSSSTSTQGTVTVTKTVTNTVTSISTTTVTQAGSTTTVTASCTGTFVWVNDTLTGSC